VPRKLRTAKAIMRHVNALPTLAEQCRFIRPYLVAGGPLAIRTEFSAEYHAWATRNCGTLLSLTNEQFAKMLEEHDAA
jgi:hypothetical protein